ncbi:hypothetical protein EDB80DRAFT_744724 [Ilyonectria destructans]|nr:hypothetical protein EDB80DRAFT_744724 [Ilyonectria destructans]
MFEFETAFGKGRGMLRLVVVDDNVWKSYLDEDPMVFVIGAGHSGIDIGVRLRHLGLLTLIIDRNERVGENWRKRYITLTTHGPVQYCHLPFMPFPSDWPLYIPKDKLADWLESYANKTEFDEQTKTWTVTVRRGDGLMRTLKPYYVVLATGQAGDPGQISHGCDHYDASLVNNLSRKRVVVVGSGSSSHDICQDCHESGAAELLDGPSKSGFRLDPWPDKSGILRKYLTRGGRYYIDVGCSQLIIDGKVKSHHSPAGVKSFDGNGLVLVAGSKLEADIVVLATGYDGMMSTARKLFGDKVGDRLGDVWDLDDIRQIWRSSGHPNFWFMGGNLARCRSNSRFVTLQIKAVELGLLKQI